MQFLKRAPVDKTLHARAENRKAQALHSGRATPQPAIAFLSPNHDDANQQMSREADHINSNRAETKYMRSLQFPNARLFLHHMLATERVSGAEAIARGAYEFGLIQPGSIDDDTQSLAADKCNCMAVGKAVLSKYFEEVRHAQYPPLNIEELWSQIERDAETYNKSAHRSSGGGSRNAQPEGCNKFAPVLFDLMLQHIQRYP